MVRGRMSREVSDIDIRWRRKAGEKQARVPRHASHAAILGIPTTAPHVPSAASSGSWVMVVIDISPHEAVNVRRAIKSHFGWPLPQSLQGAEHEVRNGAGLRIPL